MVFLKKRRKWSLLLKEEERTSRGYRPIASAGLSRIKLALGEEAQAGEPPLDLPGTEDNDFSFYKYRHRGLDSICLPYANNKLTLSQVMQVYS